MMISRCHYHAQAANSGAASAYALRFILPEHSALAALVGVQARSQTQPTAGASAVGIVVAAAAMMVGRCDTHKVETVPIAAALQIQSAEVHGEVIN